MKLNSVLLIAVTGMICSIAPFASAQDGLPVLPGGLSLRNGTFALSGITGNIIRAKLQMLLQRPDVQTNIHISVTQRSELAEFLDANKPQILRVEVHGDGAPVVTGLGDNLDTKVKETLKANQISRLHELDLQWRGYLALSDPKVQDKLQLSKEVRESIATIMKSYCETRDEQMKSAMQQQQSDETGHGTIVRMKLDTTALENPISSSRKKMQSMKDETEEKIKSAITPETKTEFVKMQGEPFRFRTDVKGEWRRVYMS